MVYFKENYCFSKVSKGFHRFPRGVQLFFRSGGEDAIFYRNLQKL